MRSKKRSCHRSTMRRIRGMFTRSTPIPTIAMVARLADELFHLSHRLFQTHKHGASDDAVTDVELDDLGDLRQPLGVSVCEAMSRIDADPQLIRQLGRLADGFQRSLLIFEQAGIGIAAG